MTMDETSVHHQVLPKVGMDVQPVWPWAASLASLLLYVVRGWWLSGTGVRGLLGLAGACSPKVQTRVETGPIRARTFAFVARDRPAPRSPDDMERVHAAIQEAITTNLAGKGVTQVTSSPDVLVAYLVFRS